MAIRRFTPGEVAEAARRASAEFQGMTELDGIVWRVAAILGWDSPEWPGQRLHDQVKRTLDKMAADGALVRIGRGRAHPSGWSNNYVSYYLPAHYKSAVEAAAAGRAATARQEARVRAISSRLSALGVANLINSDGIIYLGLEEWDTVLQALESNQDKETA